MRTKSFSVVTATTPAAAASRQSVSISPTVKGWWSGNARRAFTRAPHSSNVRKNFSGRPMPQKARTWRPFSFAAMIWFLVRSRTVERGWLCALVSFLGFVIGLGERLIVSLLWRGHRSRVALQRVHRTGVILNRVILNKVILSSVFLARIVLVQIILLGSFLPRSALHPGRRAGCYAVIHRRLIGLA